MKITEQFRRIQAGAFDNDTLAARAYRFYRALRCPAAHALIHARADAAAGVPRYPVVETGVGAADENGMRWVENPASVGLRFAGFADELADRAIPHMGWYTTPEDIDGEVYRGAVYRLPGGRGFVAGYREGISDREERWSDTSGNPAAHLDLRTVYALERDDGQALPGQGALSAALAADRMARSSAEQEREYQEAWSQGAHYERLGKGVTTARTLARELIAELRTLRGMQPAGAAHVPRICATLQEKVRTLAREVCEATAERRKLRKEYRALAGTWRDRLWEAFAEGAGLSVCYRSQTTCSA